LSDLVIENFPQIIWRNALYEKVTNSWWISDEFFIGRKNISSELRHIFWYFFGSL